MRNVVVIAGGNGSAICLEALKKYVDDFNISAVISMSDSGGSSGKLRKQLDTLPPGDVLRAILSLSIYDYQSLKKIFYKPRFKDVGKLNKHNLGNLFLTLAGQFSGNFIYALDALSQSVEAQGKVYPVTLENTDLVAELDNGRIIRTEKFIDNPRHNRGWKIKRVWLEPNCRAYSKSVETLNKADVIIIGSGSLYTSLVATLLPNGIKEAIKKSKARLIYVAGNAYRLNGETGPEKLSEMIVQLEKYLPRPVDLVIHNNHKLNIKQKKIYQENGWGVFNFDAENLKNRKIISVDFEKNEGGLDPQKLSLILKKYI
jgi:uncharacterized cofD-like protein